MYKTIHTGSFNFDDAPVRLMDVHRRGVDKDWMQKRAAVFTEDITNIRPEVGRSFIHLIAVGDTEVYGCNKNADGFGKKANIAKHHTFVTNGHVYKHHANKDPKKASGVVKCSAHNAPMSRVELIIGLDNAKWEHELQKLASGDDVAFSMACSSDPTYPVLTKRGYKEIQAIMVGDEVLTHKGRWRSVKALNRRKYTGMLYKFEMNGLPLPLEITADHPMWAKVFEGSRELQAVSNKAKRYFKDSKTFEEAPADWVHAEHVKIGDRFFYQPTPHIPGHSGFDTEDLCTLMGYYTAEGSLAYNKDRACTVQFACNMDDSLPRRVPEILERLYPDVTCHIRPHHNSKAGLFVNVFSTQFAEFMRMYVGIGCKSKTICPELFNSSKKSKLAFMGAWLDGDGWCDKKGAHISSANLYLILQGRDLLATMAIPSSIYKIDHAKCETSGYENSGIEYTLNVSWCDAGWLAGHSEKIRESEYNIDPARTKGAAMRSCPDGRYAYRIKNVTSRKVTDIQTWNIEVEEDESYTVAGLISHNCNVPFDVCSICGNSARARRFYCDHMKKMAGQILDDGRHVYVDNPDPTYFDISGVFRPADRIAYSLQKVASGGIITGAELAELDGWVPSDIGGTSLRPRSNNLFRKLSMLRKLSLIEKEIDAAVQGGDQNSEMAQLASCVDPSACGCGLNDEDISQISDSTQERINDLMAGLGRVQISLPLRDFLRILLGPDAGSISTGDVETQLPGVFTRMLEEDADGCAGDGSYDPNPAGSAGLPTKISSIIEKMVPGTSLLPKHAAHRSMLVLARKNNNMPLTKGVAIRTIKSATDRNAAELLAQEYAKYKLSFLTKVAEREGTEVSVKLGVLQNYV